MQSDVHINEAAIHHNTSAELFKTTLIHLVSYVLDLIKITHSDFHTIAIVINYCGDFHTLYIITGSA